MTPHVLSDAARIAWLRLIRSDGIGPLTFHRLMQRFAYDAEKAIDALPTLKGAVSKTSVMSASHAKKELDAAQKLGARYIAYCEPDYPAALAQLPDAPPILCVRGTLAPFLKPGIALVGARNASAAGRRMARDLASGLAEEGFVIVSGMARGIDGEAHQAALRRADDNATIAVLAGGVASIYPPEHDKLYQDIVEKGAVVTEAPLGLTARAKDFPKRNRIISGLSLAVVVVEAASRSGSLISARMALENGREVMAVPGSPLDARTAGSNGLIKQGAWLIETVDDVINALEGMATPRATPFGRPAPGAPIVHPTDIAQSQIERVLQALSPTPMALNDLATASGLTIPQTRAALVELELDGEAVIQSGGLASRPVKS